MTSMAQRAGANRILGSGRIPHPIGDPSRSKEEELAWRQDQLRKALATLTEDLDEAKVFN